MSLRRLLFGSALGVLVLFATSAVASPPNRINFQGLALDSSGNPLQGSQSVTVRIWADATSVVPLLLLYGEQHATVEFVDGVFQIAIGAGAPLAGVLNPNVFSQPNRFIELQIGSEILAPRQPVESAAYALQCANSDSVAGIAGTGLITGVSAGAGLAGGGSSGDVTLALGPDGVGAAQIADGSITSADIANSTITSTDIAAGTITSANIANDAILEQDIANEAGVGFSESSTTTEIPSGTTNFVILSTIIDAPSDGFIVASASLSAEIETSILRCSLTLDSALLDETALVVEHELEDWVFGGIEHAMALTRGFVVGSPGARVVRLVCHNGGASGSVLVNHRQLTAIFAPTGY